jgi:predicted  nucleic acid-binding Zn-ribbon protein
MVITPNKIEELNREIQDLIDKVEKEKQVIEELDKERRKKEKEFDVEREKIQKLESKLYEVKTNKEYQALLKEIETMKNMNDATEEEVLILMEKTEDLRKDHQSSTVFLKKRQSEVGSEKNKLEEELNSIEQIVTRLKTERDNLLSIIDGGLRNTYDMLKIKRGGIAVVSVKSGLCLGCFMNIPPQLFIEVMKNRQIISCPSCNRILYYSEEN